MPPDTQQHGPVVEITRFWRHLFGAGRGLLQVWTKREGVVSSNNFNHPQAAQQAAEWALEKAQEAGREVYFCAHLLTAPRRIKENAAEVFSLWGDLDGACIPNGKLAPTYVIESSPGKYHCYWALSDPVPPQAAEQLNRRLALEIGADPSGSDLTQLLRVPGTTNHKYEDHPTVKVTKSFTFHHIPADLDAILPPLPKPKAEYDPGEEEDEPPVALNTAALKVWRGEKPKAKDDGTGEIDRSASLMKIGRVLYDAGGNRLAVVEGLKERDKALGWDCYTDRGDREYQRIFDKLKEKGRNPKLNVSANNANNANSQQGFSSELPEPLPFPLEALPPTTRQFVRQAAASIDCPADYVGISVLAALSAAIGDTRRIIVKKRWLESASLYAGMVGPPGSKKTPAMNAALTPVYERQKAHRKTYESRKEEYEKDLRDYKALKKSDVVAYDPPKKPVFERNWVDDTTVERLADVLAENPRGVLLARDELSAWLRSMDQYKQGGKGSDRQFWLKAHTNQPVLVDRKSLEEPVMVHRPWVSIIGGIQPTVLSEFGKDKEDGLLQRFVFAYPEPYLGGWCEDEIEDETQETYEQTIRGLCELEHPVDGVGEPFPSKVPMAEEAKRVFIAQYNGLREERTRPEFPQKLAAAWAKMDGLLASLALIIAMTRMVEVRGRGGASREAVTKEDMDAAASLLGYFKNHTSRVYASLLDQQPQEALAADIKEILLEQGGVWQGSASQLYDVLDADYKPKRDKDLGKMVRGLANRVPWLKMEDLPRANSRRMFRLTLLAVGTVGTVGSEGATNGQVINIKTEKLETEKDLPEGTVYVGRKVPNRRTGQIRFEESIWHNPFKEGQDGTRQEVVAKFERYLVEERPDLVERLPELKGKVLACWCVPESCHAEALLRLAERA